MSWIKKIIISLSNLLIPQNVPLSILTGPLRGVRWLYHSDVPAYFFGTFERHKIEKYLIPNLQQRQVFWDIGSNVGYYALIAAKVMPKDSQIIAIEPSRRNLVFLRKHIDLNYPTKIQVETSAISDTSGVASLKQGNYGGVDALSNKEGDYDVPTLSIPDLYKKWGQVPDIIKLDVEGWEEKVLTGGKDLLSSKHPVLLLSTHSPELEKNCLSLLSSWGYKIEKIEENEFIAI